MNAEKRREIRLLVKTLRGLANGGSHPNVNGLLKVAAKHLGQYAAVKRRKLVEYHPQDPKVHPRPRKARR
jgi:hypothetical protein